MNFKTNRQEPNGSIALFACVALTACGFISPYDQAAYAQAVNLKVDTLALIDKATGSYTEHAGDIRRLNLALAKGYEYDKNRSHNEITRKMWEVLLFKNPSDPRDGILRRFFEEWKTAGTPSSQRKSPTTNRISPMPLIRSFSWKVERSGKRKHTEIHGKH